MLVSIGRIIPVVCTVIFSISACASTHVRSSEHMQGGSTQRRSATVIPGVPNLPDVVTVVPFYGRPNEDDEERTEVVIPAEVDGRHGLFMVDIGSPVLMLNRTFLQPGPAHGIDTVTDTDRIPDHTQAEDPKTFDKVHVTMRIGTLSVKFDDPDLAPANAYLGHMWHDFAGVGPRLGNLGPSVLEQFETIIDYTHRRLILIRLDAAGHRLAEVPAYTPRRTLPLIDDREPGTEKIIGPYWGLAVGMDGQLDTLDATRNIQILQIDTGNPNRDVGGSYFLMSFGVVGFNHRLHQFILYRGDVSS